MKVKILIFVGLLLPFFCIGQIDNDKFYESLGLKKDGELNDTITNDKKPLGAASNDKLTINSVILEQLNGLIEIVSTEYYTEDKSGTKWRNRESNISNLICLNIDGYLLSSSFVVSPWVLDSTFIGKKDEIPKLARIMDTKNQDHQFKLLGKSLAMAMSKKSSHLELGIYNSELHNGVLVISSGTIEEKLYEEIINYDSFSDVSMVRIESSYDNYHGSFMLAPRFDKGRIEFDLIAIGIPSTAEKNSKPILYNITKGDVSDFMNMKKKDESKSSKSQKKTTKKSSKKKDKRKKFLGIF